jgi:hypothetical protein
MIGMNTLKSVLRLDIDDFGLDAELSRSIRTYSDTLSEYLQRHGLDFSFIIVGLKAKEIP